MRRGGRPLPLWGQNMRRVNMYGWPCAFGGTRHLPLVAHTFSAKKVSRNPKNKNTKVKQSLPNHRRAPSQLSGIPNVYRDPLGGSIPRLGRGKRSLSLGQDSRYLFPLNKFNIFYLAEKQKNNTRLWDAPTHARELPSTF